MKIAIIGGGISGLTAALLLHQDHDIHLFEQADYAGGHARTIKVDIEGRTIPIDTGFIVFNQQTSPYLVSLLNHLEIPVKDAPSSLSISLDQGSFECVYPFIRGVLARPSSLLSPHFHYLLKETIRFNWHARRTVQTQIEIEGTVGDFLDRHNFSSEWQAQYLLPLAACLWVCPPLHIRTFAAHSFLRFFYYHDLFKIFSFSNLSTLQEGVRSYIEKMMEPFKQKVSLSTKIVRVERHETGVLLTNHQEENLAFDQVIFAIPSHQVLTILTQPTANERRLLGSFIYQRNHLVLHHDSKIMPKNRSMWAGRNYHPDPQGTLSPTTSVSFTYWLNYLQELSISTPTFLSINPSITLDPVLVRYQSDFAHPTFNAHSFSLQQELSTIQGHNHSWFCGAYTRQGFHEDGLVSAVKIAERLECRWPFPLSEA